MRFDLNSYETVEERLERFWSEHPEGRVLTSLLSDPNHLDECVVRAEVYFDAGDDRPRGTGLAFEKRGGAGANQTSHLENAETSSIGRALANCGYKAKKEAPRPSREEMRKAQPPVQAQPVPRQEPRPAPAAAPESAGDWNAAREAAANRSTPAEEAKKAHREAYESFVEAYRKTNLPRNAAAMWKWASTTLRKQVTDPLDCTVEDFGELRRAADVTAHTTNTEQPLPLAGGESAPPDDGEALKHWRH